MGLADRFKDSLENKDIFQRLRESESEDKAELKIVSNPIKRNRNFEDLETDIIDKIRKTPYWSEYTISKQKNMISAYFCRKLKNKIYSEFEKEEFVQNILVLSNND